MPGKNLAHAQYFHVPRAPPQMSSFPCFSEKGNRGSERQSHPSWWSRIPCKASDPSSDSSRCRVLPHPLQTSEMVRGVWAGAGCGAWMCAARWKKARPQELQSQSMWPSLGTSKPLWELQGRKAGGVCVCLGGHFLQINTSVRELGHLPVTEAICFCAVNCG